MSNSIWNRKVDAAAQNAIRRRSTNLEFPEASRPGGGVYDPECGELRERFDADGVLLIVLNGSRGHGFSCAALLPAVRQIPDILENIARQMREQMPGGGR